MLGHVSRYLTGACIEDVNREIYGGVYSQMIFGESFQEAVNTAGAPCAVAPRQRPWKHGIRSGSTNYDFPPYSFTVLRLE